SGIVPPYSYYTGKELNGYDIELAYRFAAWLGADVEFKVYDYGAIFSAAIAGDIDCIMANLEYTEERAEEMPYSDLLFEVKIGLMVRGDAVPAPADANQTASSLDALNGKRIGVATGTTFDAIVLKALPDAKLVYINSSADLIASLEAGKIDGFAVDEPAAKQFCGVNPRLTVVDEYLDSFDFGIVLPKTAKGDALLEELNAWLLPMKESGALERVIEKWANGPEEGKTLPDYAAFPAAKGTLTLATEGDYVPMTYYRGTEIVGAEIDLIAQFCEANGYGLKVQVMNFDGILPAVQTGKADFAAAGISITDERRESVNFSVPYYSGGTVMVVLKDPALVTEQAAKTVRWQDYNGKRIGVLVGPLMEDAAKEYFPDSEYLLFNTYPDCIAALLAGKIDAYLGDELGLFAVHAEQPEIDYIHDRITQNNYAFAFRKNDPASAALCAELNDFLKRSRENGTMEDLENIWYGIDEDKKVVDMSGLTGENGTIRVVTTSTDAPFSYIKDGKNVGYDIDLVVRFCRDRGYALELGDVDFAGRIPAIQSGKYDFTTDMNVTPERQEQVLFSDPTGYGGIVLAVLSSDLAASDASQVSTGAEKSFLDSIQDSFNKTFIRENRWELFGNGVLTTLLITVLSILFGTVLGFAVFMMCRNGNIFANGVTRFSMWLVQGMPMVVLLMILYYIIFGSVAISGIFVAVIGFTLTFGASVFGLLKMGVGTIDRGQYEAAYALGYANRRTFFRIILPQAIPHILPAYKGEIVGLIKATAIVGYIAVQDLTKMGDIVRSRTYEAFFPLIAVTVIYFVLEGLLCFLVSKI
ncbi:MAG: transporter substrate-binding domain-containing protein, partial [Clostridia bacterium]|nr:transporter substrate-binding domain-containing protein [Clostridia bacterium]